MLTTVDVEQRDEFNLRKNDDLNNDIVSQFTAKDFENSRKQRILENLAEMEYRGTLSKH